MKTINTKNLDNNLQDNEKIDPRMNYWRQRFGLTTEQIKSALASVGDNYNLLEGFLRKNQGLHGH